MQESGADAEAAAARCEVEEEEEILRSNVEARRSSPPILEVRFIILYLGPIIVPALGELHEVLAGLRGLVDVELDDKVAGRGRESDAGGGGGRRSHCLIVWGGLFEPFLATNSRALLVRQRASSGDAIRSMV